MDAVFFDKQDYELLRLINLILERDRDQPGRYAEKLLEPNLHPNGIKELGLSHDMRIAYAVINLLESLEVGLAEDRLIALKALHDEVMFGTITSLKYNTGRVLIQIMKEIVRSHGDYDMQLHLVHDFRSALTGKARIIRSLLQRYYLLEMPESWDQHAFDDHVHDANTKGRKSPTHLIMDAWIKGIRYLTVIYYNYVQPVSVSELMRAAEIMGMKVTIGLEFQGRFRGRYVDIIWQPTGFSDYKEMLDFFAERPTSHILRMGQEASRYNEQYVFALLERYNEAHRLDMENLFKIELPPISREEFLSFVGIGQPSLLHLAELVYKHCLPGLEKRHAEIEAAYPTASAAEKMQYDLLLKRISAMDSSEIQERWLSREYNSDVPDPSVPANTRDLPEIMRLSVHSIVDWITSIRPNSKVTLGLGGLRLEDVVELLYDCEGLITHLELFNLKYYRPSESEEIEEINKLQLAINGGSSVALKRMVLATVRKYRGMSSNEAAERVEKLLEILKHIQQLKDYYKITKLRSSIGSDSTSRSNRLHGMGFVNLETLPQRALRELRKEGKNHVGAAREQIPLYEKINACVMYYPHRSLPLHSRWVSFLRRMPIVRYFMHYYRHTWVVDTSKISFSKEHGNISTLGGVQKDMLHNPCRKPDSTRHLGPKYTYLNTGLRNLFKVLLGFMAAMLTFQYTQSWWVLAWFGAVIWFGVTGLRNIVQAVLGGGGLRRSPFLRRWNNFVSWSRLCDSLMYTGFSVPLLELVTKTFLLQNTLHLSPTTSPWLFFAIMSGINGLYLFSHNMFRGLPTSAAVANIFRSIFAIPIAIFYTGVFEWLLSVGGAAQPDLIVLQVSTILSKVASDTVAGVIEGLADRSVNIRVRYWDYQNKLARLFNTFSHLELLMPEEDSVLETLAQPEEYSAKNNEPVWLLEKDIIIDSLDFMYFWMYQPRSRPALKYIVGRMTREERHIFCRAQYVLTREKEVSQMMVDGMLGSNFSRPLSFYLGHVRNYLEEMRKITKVSVKVPEIL